MRQALQPHMELRGLLNFSNQLVRADLTLLQNRNKIAAYAHSEALYEELLSGLQFFGISNVARFLEELEKDFAKYSKITPAIPGNETRSDSLARANRILNNVYENAKTEAILHGSFTFQSVNARLAVPRSALVLSVQTFFAMNYKRQGCEGSCAARVRSGRNEEAQPHIFSGTKRRTAANAEPVAARPRSAAHFEVAPKQRAQSYPVSEPGGRAVFALFTGGEACEGLGGVQRQHIKHTMRMVRIHKAEEIIDAEMQRRQSVLEEKKQQFYAKLDNTFQVNGAQRANPEVMAARDAVYMRMAAQAESGNFNYTNEFKAWFWGGGQWASNVGQAAYGAALGGTQVQITPLQIAEASTGILGAALMPASDQNAVGLWLGTGGSLAAFSGFQGVYTGYLMTIMAHDLELIRNAITQAVMATVMAAGVATIAAAASLQSVLMSNPYTAVAGQAIVQTLRAAGMAQITYAQSQIIISQAQYMMALFGMIFMGAATFNSGFMPQIYDVMAKQGEYEDAQAAVDYFNKVPDMETMKERMVQWGAQHGDNDSGNNLYDLTEEDLKYLFDRDGNGDPVYQTSTGATQTLTAEEQNEALDVSGFENQVEFKDAFGRRYDPDTLTSTGGPRDGNAYIIGGEKYTRVRAMQNNGGTVYQYAKIIADSEPLEDAYNMGSIMDMLVQHGTDLRTDRKQRYLAAGAAATTDTTFVYAERDATYDDLYAQATDQNAGGREYSGYRLTHADYVENQSDVFGSELQQRVAVQNKEWDLREQELQDRYEEWERKMDVLMARGRSSWGNAENRFLQEWREWEKKIDREEAEGNTKWDDQIAGHFEKKQEWEEEVRDQASEANLTEVLTQSVNELNNQIAIANQNMGANMASISTTAYVTQILAGLENDKPSFTDKFASVNKSIKDFKTRLSVSELSGANLGAALTPVNGDYRESLRLHAKNLKVLANVKVFEEYRKLFDGFKAQLEDQNAIIDQQTQSAAFNAGFVRSGAFFVKTGNISDSLGLVNAYDYFDTAGVLREELAKSGFNEMDGGELTDFLEGKDGVEVEAYFHVQKLALQRVYEVLMGKGTQEERRESQDEQIIGRFGTWAGKAPGGSNGESNLASNAVSASKIDVADGGNTLSALKYLGFAGFGEQGIMGIRPGGAPLGFYPQLELAGMLTGRGDSDALAGANSQLYDTMGFMGDVYRPIEAMINQYNVPLSFMNAYKNVELASKVDGKAAGYMWEAQAIDLLKTPITMAGGAFMTAGTMALISGVGAAMAPFMYLGGMAANAIGNSISVDPRTGKRLTKWSDQAAVNTGTSIVTSSLAGVGMAAKAAGTATTAFANASKAINIGTSAGQQGLVYNSSGTLTGVDFSGFRGVNAAVSGGIGYLSGKLGEGIAENHKGFQFDTKTFGGAFGSSVFGGAISSTMTTAAEYAKHQAWGAQHSNFGAMATPGLGNVGGLLGMAFSAGITSNQEAAVHAHLQSAKQSALELLAQNANNEASKNAARDILAGAGYSFTRREELLQRLEYEAAYTTRNIGSSDAAYKAREVASQMGMAKDGRGQLYRDVQKELNRIVGKGEQASYADIQKAAENVARAKGLDLTGKQVDWGRVNEGHFSAVGADIRNQAPQRIDNSVVFSPIVLSSGAGYAITYDSASDQHRLQSSGATRARQARMETGLTQFAPGGAVDSRMNVPMQYWVEAHQRQVQNRQNIRTMDQMYGSLGINEGKTLSQTIAGDIARARTWDAAGRVFWGSMETIGGVSMLAGAVAGEVISLGTATVPAALVGIVGGGMTVHGIAGIGLGSMEMYSASIGGEYYGKPLSELLGFSGELAGASRSEINDLRRYGSYADDGIGLLGGGRAIQSLSAPFVASRVTGGFLAGNAMVGATAGAATDYFMNQNPDTLVASAFSGARTGMVLTPMSSLQGLGHMARGSVAGVGFGIYDATGQFVVNGEVNPLQSLTAAGLAFGGTALASGMGALVPRELAASGGQYRFLTPSMQYLMTEGTGSIYAAVPGIFATVGFERWRQGQY